MGLPLGPSQKADIAAVFEVLGTNLEIGSDDQFDVQVFIDGVIDALATIAANLITDDTMCAKGVIDTHVNRETAVPLMVDAITSYREAITTLDKIKFFLEEYAENLSATFDPESLEVFVDEIIERSFCSRCTITTQPMCTNVCGAVVRAAYSPFYTELRDQFNLLFSVARDDVEIIEGVITTFLSATASILDTSIELVVSGESRRKTGLVYSVVVLDSIQ